MQRLGELVKKYRNGGGLPEGDPKKVNYGGPSVRSLVADGLASNANPSLGSGGGANINLPRFDEMREKFVGANPDLFDSKKQQYIIDGKKTYFPNTTAGFDEARMASHMSNGDKSKFNMSSYQGDIYHGLMGEFDGYIDGFDGKIENMTEDQIKRMREQYQEQTRNFASQMNRD